MFTQKDAKTMAKSLRDALVNRNVQLSHGDCLEIVARQFGSLDWNTLSAKLISEEDRDARQQDIEVAPPTATPADVSAPETVETIEPAPWTTCSFCGKSRPEVRILFGGCGGWEGFRKRRNPASGERSNVFICNECIALCTRITAVSPAAE